MKSRLLLREDVTDMVLNIKNLAVKLHAEGPRRMTLKAEGLWGDAPRVAARKQKRLSG